MKQTRIHTGKFLKITTVGEYKFKADVFTTSCFSWDVLRIDSVLVIHSLKNMCSISNSEQNFLPALHIVIG